MRNQAKSILKICGKSAVTVVATKYTEWWRFQQKNFCQNFVALKNCFTLGHRSVIPVLIAVPVILIPCERLGVILVLLETFPGVFKARRRT
jgi:hypothetical protein